MAAGHSVARDFMDSTFPVTAVWDGPREAWHDSYPDGIPPRISYTDTRAEQLLLAAAGRWPDRMAVRYFQSSMTFSQLIDTVSQAAGSFRSLGIEAGDRVMLVLANSPEFIVSWFALHWLGAQVVPVNPLNSAVELSHLAEKCRIKAVVGLDVRLRPVLEMARQVHLPVVITTSLAPHLPLHFRLPYLVQKWLHDRQAKRAGLFSSTRCLSWSELLFQGEPVPEPVLTDPRLPAVLQPTGGTTGTPKVAILTHANLCANVAQLHVWSGLEPGRENFLSVLPFFHVYGATCAMLSPLSGGSTLILQARFHPKRTLDLMRKWETGVALLVPFMIASLSEEIRRSGRRPDALRLCMSGASALSEDVAREFTALTGATLMEGFGLSEASPVTHSNPANGQIQIGSIGLPLPGTEARLVDLETGLNDVAPGEVGELIIRGPQVMQGYLDDPEETAIALRRGWLYTGDLAQAGADGFFRIVDRKKDMIITGGLNVYPSEVEQVLMRHPSVAKCAVVARPDRRYGELVCAWVVPAAGAVIDGEAIKAFCHRELAGYKVPKEILPCESLPETFLGKLRRADLRKAA